MPYHPEYCFIEYCEDANNKGSFEFEALMRGTATLKQADNAGLVNPQQNGNAPSGLTMPTALQADPFTNGLLNGYCTLMDPVLPFTTSIWQATLAIVHDPLNLGTVTIPSQFGSDPCIEDREWRTFRALYRAYRHQLVMLDYQAYSGCVAPYPVDGALGGLF